MTPLFIEFTGLPGAGKTTIARVVSAELTKLGFRCYCNGNLSNPHRSQPLQPNRLLSKTNTLYQLIRSCSRDRQIALDALNCAIQAKPRRFISFRRVADLLIRLDLIKAILNDNYNLVIFDQGLIQCAWSITATGNLPPDSDLMRLLRSILSEIPLVLIHIKIDPDSAIDRINQRATMSSRFDKMPAVEAKQLLARQVVFFDRLSHWQAELPRIHRLTVDGSYPVAENACQIVEFIQTLSSSALKIQEGV